MNKTFRLFVSSTFSDFTPEREVLQSRVFPEIRKYCAKKGGFSFQPIDLRWGVSAEAQLDQKTLELCLNEVHSCKSHPVPNFVILAGDRYGWIPLPYAIEKREFETLLEHVNDEEESALRGWYEEDLNAIPISYILNERSGEYEEYAAWAGVEEHLRALLQRAAEAADLPAETVERYFLSATEAEVMEGILDYTPDPTPYQQRLIDRGLLQPGWDRQHVFGFIRTIEGEIAGTAFDDGHHESVVRFKERIRSSVENVLEVRTVLADGGELEGSYLAEFENRILSFLKERVDLMASEADAVSPLEAEKQAQRDFLEGKLRNFQGRERLREIIAAYAAGTPHSGIEEIAAPLIVYGPSGRGKSALMAKAIAEVQAGAGSTVVYRFTSATPSSSSSKGILLSIFEELGVSLDESAPGSEVGDQGKSESFEDFSERVRLAFLDLGSRSGTIVIVLDALDQVSNPDRLLWLPDRLPENVKIVISLLNDEKYPEDSKYYRALSGRKLNFHEIPPLEDPIKLLQATLAESGRQLQEHQEVYFLTQYASSQSPLFVTLAAEELKHWKSSDGVEEGENPPGTRRVQDLADSQRGLVREFVSNLHEFYNHDEEFVARVLGYIHASRDGLSESELLQLLSAESGLVQKMAPDTWHKNITGELPMVIWSRLAMQLRPFFKRSSQDGQELLSFFHREFSTVIAEGKEQQLLHRLAVDACQKMVSAHMGEGFENNRWGRLYLTLVTEHELRYPKKSELESDARFVSELEDDNYIEALLNCAEEEGDSYSLIEKTGEAIVYRRFGLFVSKPLYEENPDRWAGRYTTSLNNLALSYDSVGRSEDAIALYEESLFIRKALYEENPDRWAENYTTSLNNLANSYRLVGRSDDAIGLEKESLLIRKPLYEENPDRWAENYTSSLLHLANSYRLVGRSDDAIALEEESLFILKPLYEKNPSRWAKDYTPALNNLGMSYKSVGRSEDAIALEEESLLIRKTLYEENPERWAEKYTSSLFHIANSYDSVGRSEDAIALKEESLFIRKALYEGNPDRWANNYATSLLTLASSYDSVGRSEDAIALKEESLFIWKALYEENPDRWAEKYTTSLLHIAYSYKSVGRSEDAIALEEESLFIRKVLYEENPDRWTENYTSSLLHLANSYRSVGRSDDAIALEEESLLIRKPLYEENPDRWAGDYTSSLLNLAYSYKSVDRSEDAIALEEESLFIRKALYEENPDRWAEDYTSSLLHLANSYRLVGRSDDAIALEEDSLFILKPLYEENPDRWAENYTTSLNNLANSYRLVGRRDDAIALEEDSLAILKALYEGNPDGWAGAYATSLNNLGVRYREQGGYDEAEHLVREAVTISVDLYGEHHKETATLFSSLGWLLHLKGNDAESIEFLEKALEVRSELFGADAAPAVKVRERLEEVRHGISPEEQ